MKGGGRTREEGAAPWSGRVLSERAWRRGRRRGARSKRGGEREASGRRSAARKGMGRALDAIHPLNNGIRAYSISSRRQLHENGQKKVANDRSSSHSLIQSPIAPMSHGVRCTAHANSCRWIWKFNIQRGCLVYYLLNQTKYWMVFSLLSKFDNVYKNLVTPEI